MGRVQDDGLYASIWDMIVLPEHRGQGIGGGMFERMLAHCHGRSLVTLVATPLGAPIYRAAGFSEESRARSPCSCATCNRGSGTQLRA